MVLSIQNRKWLFSIVVATGMTFVLPVMAQGQDTDAYRARTQKWPQASLQAEVSAEVAQDTVQITLATEVSGNDQPSVAKALTAALDKAMKNAKDNPKVKVSSGNYRVWPMNNRDGKISNWRGRGEILLESTDFAAASELASSFSDSLPVVNIMFSVSPQARAKQEQDLLAQAAEAFQNRAQSLAEALGFSAYTLREVNLSGSGAHYSPAPRGVMALAMDSTEKSSLPLEGGTEQVTVSIQGSIFLQPTQK